MGVLVLAQMSVAQSKHDDTCRANCDAVSLMQLTKATATKGAQRKDAAQDYDVATKQAPESEDENASTTPEAKVDIKVNMDKESKDGVEVDDETEKGGTTGTTTTEAPTSTEKDEEGGRSAGEEKAFEEGKKE